MMDIDTVQKERENWICFERTSVEFSLCGYANTEKKTPHDTALIQ